MGQMRTLRRKVQAQRARGIGITISKVRRMRLFKRENERKARERRAKASDQGTKD